VEVGERIVKFDVLTLFPEVFPGSLEVGVVGRALEQGDIAVEAHDLRDWTEDKHRQVDDIIYGGGAGMVLKPEPLIKAVGDLRDREGRARTILLSPQGRVFTQEVARELAQEERLVLVCGRYQGVDERARDFIGEELSIGDYILSGGEVAALVVIEAVARLVPGTLGSPESLQGETFSTERAGAFEAPLYTRPHEFGGESVPEVLRSGDHAAIESWRQGQSLERTRRSRPDLLPSDVIPRR
jgi:tRNA (guanine37-N1)-methyltransferase